MPHNNKRTVSGQWTVSGAMLLAALAPNAMAEELALEEVLVTAQKQEQSLQDTPVTVNAISAETYNNSVSFDLKDIDRLTAGVDISGNSFNQDFQVRGLGTNLDAGTSTRVNVYKDGSFVNLQRGVFLSQFDLQRFELLRGPQGTLFGRASPAGSLLIFTEDPSLEKYDGYVKLSAFSREGSNSQFGASVPVIEDKLGLRVAGLFDKNSNEDIHNETRGDDQITRTSGGRLKLKWLASDRLDARVSYNYTELSSDSYEIVRGGGYDEEDRRALSNEDSFLHIRDEHAIAELNYEVAEDITLTSSTYYQEVKTDRFQDGDAGPTANNTQGNLANTQDVESDVGKVWNTELRLHNTTGDKWSWITGLYYSKTEATTQVESLTSAPSAFGPIVNTLDLTALNSNEDWALFHHSGIQLTANDKLTIGVRYNDNATNARTPYTSDTYIVAANFTQTESGEGIPLDVEKREFEVWTGTVKFQHDFNDRVMGYVSWDKGWRNASSVVDATGTVPAELVTHKDEDSINYEAGIKGYYWGGRGLYLGNVYYQIYDDFQFQADGVLVDTDGDGIGDRTFNTVVNADKAITSGAEAETTMLLSENWTGVISLSYNDTEFDSFNNAPCTSGALVPVNGYNTCDYTGRRVSDAPNWSAVVSSEYRIPVVKWGSEWYFSALVKYESFRRDVNTQEKLDEYTLVDLFAGLRSSQGEWDVKAWVKNATDEAVIESIEVNSFGSTQLTVSNPLTAGLTGTYRWGID